MKKCIICIFALLLVLSFMGCSNGDPTADAYNEACKLFIEGQFSEAKVAFEALQNYGSSADIAKYCEEIELKNQLQGCWEVYTGEQLFVLLDFDSSKLSVKSADDKQEYLSGTYWLDFENQLIYVSNDEADDQNPIELNLQNTDIVIADKVGYDKYCSFTIDNGKLNLESLEQTDSIKFVKQESNS